MAYLTLKTISDGKSERRKVVDNLMNLILKEKFAVFGSILREIRLFKVRNSNCLYEIEVESLNYCYALLLNLNSMKLKAKISMEMSRSMSTME